MKRILDGLTNQQRYKGKPKNWWRIRYHYARHHAKERGIAFLFTFEEWCDIWEKSGKWPLYGNRRGHYCMARYGDKGPYAVGNVRICLSRDNHAEWVDRDREMLSKQMLGEQNVNVKFWATASEQRRNARKIASSQLLRGRSLPTSTREAMSAAHRERWASMIPAERAARIKQMHGSDDPEKQRVGMKKVWAERTPDQRAAIAAKKSWAWTKRHVDKLMLCWNS